MPSFGASATLVLSMIALVVRCGACSVVYRAFTVASTFRVRVADHGRPVEALGVEIGNGIRVITDKHGFALFRNVRPGRYHLSADHDAEIPDGADIKVKRDGPTNVTVPLQWPSIAPVSVRSLKGTIRGPDSLPGQTQPSLSLDLLEGTSGRRKKTLQTNDRGGFDFGTAASGLYFLKLHPSELLGVLEEVTGLIAVSVDGNANNDYLELDLGWSSCGMGYTDSSKCVQSDLQAEKLSGQVIDPSGAGIPGAKIILVDSIGTPVQQSESDGQGRFELSHYAAGTYEFVVSSGGFTPYRRAVRTDGRAELAPSSRLTVNLGFLGSCSVSE